MNIFVTASNEAYSLAKKISISSAHHLGRFDKCVAYDIDTMIDDDFKKRNIEILSIKKGAGLWLWKPYFIYKALSEECSDGDILFYLDTAGFFIKDVKKIITKMDDDFFIAQLPFVEEEFTKKETFDIMNLTEEKYTKTRQVQASLIAFRKNQRTVEFVKEWLSYCCNIDIISHKQSLGSQITSFVDHRMDQSILSLLCKKHEIKSHQDPTQFGLKGLGYSPNLANTYCKINIKNEYPVIIILHKRRRFIWIWIIKILISINMPFFITNFINRYIRNEDK
jgi:hypothetical protein